jgi:catechol 2,3-dioxygenase
VGEWNLIRDWCDHFAGLGIEIVWGPGRHGPGNNLFAFIKDPDDNWIEISAELEVIFDRDIVDWPQSTRTLNTWGRAFMRS